MTEEIQVHTITLMVDLVGQDYKSLLMTTDLRYKPTTRKDIYQRMLFSYPLFIIHSLS